MTKRKKTVPQQLTELELFADDVCCELSDRMRSGAQAIELPRVGFVVILGDPSGALPGFYLGTNVNSRPVVLKALRSAIERLEHDV